MKVFARNEEVLLVVKVFKQSHITLSKIILKVYSIIFLDNFKTYKHFF